MAKIIKGGGELEHLNKEVFMETSNVNKKSLEDIVSLVEELVINKVRIEKIKNEISDNSHAKILDQELRIISEIQASVKNVRRIKLKTIYPDLSDLVLEKSKQYERAVSFELIDQDTEVENTLVDYIHEVLYQFIRSIFDNDLWDKHLESHQIRVTTSSDGKYLTTYLDYSSCNFDEAALCKSYNVEKLEVSLLEDDEFRRVLNTIGFSEKSEDLIKLKKNLQYANGMMYFESIGEGLSRISTVIPLSSSIMQGMLVTIGDHTFAIPLEYLETIINTKSVNIQEFQTHSMIIHMERPIVLIRGNELLDIESSGENGSILILTAHNKQLGLMVDNVLDQTDMVIKPKHSILANITEFRGTTILGDGQITLVLDVPSIVRGI